MRGIFLGAQFGRGRNCAIFLYFHRDQLKPTVVKDVLSAFCTTWSPLPHLHCGGNWASRRVTYLAFVGWKSSIMNGDGSLPGNIIRAITWTSEHQADNREHFELCAEFTNPEAPLDIKYGCLGKYARSDDGTLKKNRTNCLRQATDCRE